MATRMTNPMKIAAYTYFQALPTFPKLLDRGERDDGERSADPTRVGDPVDDLVDGGHRAPERQPTPDVGAPSSGKAEPSRRPTTRKAGKEDREENQPGEARRFFFSCRAVTVVSKVGSAVARDTSHLQGFGDIKSKGNTHINPAHEKHSATDRPTAGFWPARASCRQGSYSLDVYRASRRMRMGTQDETGSEHQDQA